MSAAQIDAVKLSRTVAHALRHEPWLYELELDDEGWVPAADLLSALRQRRDRWGALGLADLEAMVAGAGQGRYEMHEGRIRALYGHSLPDKLSKVPARPPQTLYHATAPATVPAIMDEGLRPMSRQYVHLSLEIETAQRVGKRKDPHPVMLVVRAAEAHDEGVTFYEGNAFVWLADVVPPAYISVGGNSE